MILTKRQISALASALRKGKAAENNLSMSMQKMACLIGDYTGVIGCVDYSPGDGFGFTPESNDDTHIPMDELIEIAKAGVDINHDEIESRTSI